MATSFSTLCHYLTNGHCRGENQEKDSRVFQNQNVNSLTSKV